MGLVYLTYIYHKHQPNVGKYTSPVVPMEKSIAKSIRKKKHNLKVCFFCGEDLLVCVLFLSRGIYNI